MKRFWSKVDTSGECWTFDGARNNLGYGKFKFRGKVRQAHRVAWMLERGEIPDGLCVLHRCDNPPCVNPDHLWVGTMADNVRDMMKKGRHDYEPHPGEANGFAKLTASEVRSIKRELTSSEDGDPPGTYRDSRGVLRDAETHRFLPNTQRTQAEIGEDYGVSREAVKDIKSGRRWAHVEI